jgi:3-deoxy-manno-octulosonate cytidylyltransferase (CMP-KDO synthetase)
MASHYYMKKNIIGIIPARYASTRFPGKPLVDIRGKSMIRRVYEQARKCASLSDVIVATDDTTIEKAVLAFGGKVCLTSPAHPSGTDRCAEVVTKLGLTCDAVINIQGDEPFIDPHQIDLVCACFDDDRTALATLIKKITSPEILFNANSPKVIIDHEQFAIYFSRHPLPYIRGHEETQWLNQHTFYQHIGIYGYRTEVLKKITKLTPSLLEKAESLEQLRWLEHGYKIKTAITTLETFAVDTPDDLDRILHTLKL